ncbi:MAG TPA: pantetheine-phosphate adenylyltransferase [Bacillota bacterium]|nr:pantetheine-phosphate adenylyltransferase [Bacillota bacterium]HOH10279.1 pantetheine-phosphate adenylyltransferase [Bacillota bacterium]HPI02142.1 pantetheine-phosphate adenylyltransferase [Bacillota bacterium]HPM63906.1 pantetheine-phosphate adenylyltransferase [Bacillota bacterium]HQJ25480.1 pantetheine-phosphate adenylyltransferase [Bacillota bacterium]
MNVAIFPGSFDPPTNGHMDIIERAAKIYDRLIVAVLRNTAKNYMFNDQQRVEMLEKACEGIDNVEVASFEGLLVDFARKRGSRIILRGLRAVTDFEYEFIMALMNKKLAPEIETVFIVTSAENQFISSSSIKEIAHFGGPVEDMVPKPVASILRKR